MNRTGSLRLILSLLAVSVLVVLSGSAQAISLRYKLTMLGYDEREVARILSRKETLRRMRTHYRKTMLGYPPAPSFSPFSGQRRRISRRIPIQPVTGYLRAVPAFHGGVSPRQAKDLLAEARPYLPIISEAASRNELVTSLILAVIKVESGFDPGAVSEKGAMGLMQLMPDTATELEVADPLDPRENILGGARYLADCLETFGDLRLALAAYNAGPGRVARLKRVPRIEETENYVNNIIYYKKVYDHLLARTALSAPHR